MTQEQVIEVEERNILTLLDDSGKEMEYEVLVSLEIEGKGYLFLSPADEEEFDEVVAFRFEEIGEAGTVELFVIEDSQELEIVSEAFNHFIEEVISKYE